MASRPESTIVRLSVGGVPFVSSRSTLTRYSDSFFAKLLDGALPTENLLLELLLQRHGLRNTARRLSLEPLPLDRAGQTSFAQLFELVLEGPALLVEELGLCQVRARERLGRGALLLRDQELARQQVVLNIAHDFGIVFGARNKAGRSRWRSRWRSRRLLRAA